VKRKKLLIPCKEMLTLTAETICRDRRRLGGGGEGGGGGGGGGEGDEEEADDQENGLV
jgi:hypothetical protein